MERVLLSGNEAIARGAWEAGVCVGVGYPGTPSTETLERFAKLSDVHAEWAPNEKVALEVAAGVSFAGRRVLVTMKHVGMNVAADALFTLAYTGVRGGLVILIADDPGMHSSQNEQDSRNYAAFARVPILEPSDSAEALEFTKLAFDLSERFDVPVLLRSTVRLSHAKSLAVLGERTAQPEPDEYKTDPAKWVMMPGMAKVRRIDLDRRMDLLAAYSDECPINRLEMRDTGLGIVCSGAVYQHVREALPDASVFKVGIGYPAPVEPLRGFAASVDRLIVIEEADPYLERHLDRLGITHDPSNLPVAGEISPGMIRAALGLDTPMCAETCNDLPPRPPLLCPGCPHRPVFHILGKLKAVVTGDIGCYTLGALRPLAAMDSCVCMGASIGMAHGIHLAGGVGKRPVVAVIGDSTFAHSGVTGLMNVVYNGGTGVVAILDNRITAMTGHQGNPINGITLGDHTGREVDLLGLVKSLGVDRVRVVDAQDIAAIEVAFREEIAADELSVIIFRAPCALLLKEKSSPVGVDDDICTACGACIKLGCPAIGKHPTTHRAHIDSSVCNGCGQCVQVCRFDAISPVADSCGKVS